MLFAAYFFLYLIVFAFGSTATSFVNVIVYRMPKKISPFKGRSFCPACGEGLRGFDLVPVASYFILRRRCRHCGGRISPRYAAVELAGGMMAVICYAAAGAVPGALFFLSGAVLLADALIDADTNLLPDSLLAALFVCGVAAVFLVPSVAALERVLGIFAVSVPMLLLALVIRGSFGGGDIKLAAAGGLLLGFKNMLLAMFIAIVLGGGYAIYLLASGKKSRREKFAFGPFLASGIFIALLFGDFILGWYLGLFS